MNACINANIVYSQERNESAASGLSSHEPGVSSAMSAELLAVLIVMTH